MVYGVICFGEANACIGSYGVNETHFNRFPPERYESLIFPLTSALSMSYLVILCLASVLLLLKQYLLPPLLLLVKVERFCPDSVLCRETKA
eukprot:7840158-Heterocapsa_arctica.AAC.1